MRGHPTRRCECRSCPRDKLIRLVEQPVRHAPKSEVDSNALLLVVERRNRRGFLEDFPVVVINPEVERVVRYHPKHQTVAEHACLAEHAPHCETAERSQLLAEKLGKAVAGNHLCPPFRWGGLRLSPSVSLP